VPADERQEGFPPPDGQRPAGFSPPDEVSRVLVAGAGVMGSSIAQVLATTGLEVQLLDVEAAALERALCLVEGGLSTLAEAGRVEATEIPVILSRIQPYTDLGLAVRGAEVVFEAVSESPRVKRDLLLAVDEACGPQVVIASNTSSLDVFGLAELGAPERLVIAHFFAPAHIIPLVELVPGSESDPGAVRFMEGLLQRMGKQPILLDSFVPSFIVNRIQNAIGVAVQEILENGWAGPEQIDRAVKLSLGVRLPIVGVAQTADFNGLDLVCQIFAGIGRPSAYFQGKVEHGDLGVKSGRGLYDYGGRSEVEVLRKRDLLYLKMLDALDEIGAFEPV
jgi:3-hydroxybutyryl-CoA dehydrogenase